LLRYYHWRLVPELTTAESKAAHHAISTLFPEPIDPKGKPLVVQYEVKLQKGLECGGAYIKLLTEEADGLRAGAEYTDKVSAIALYHVSSAKCTDPIHNHVWSRQVRLDQQGPLYH
jgi:calnexin